MIEMQNLSRFEINKFKLHCLHCGTPAVHVVHDRGENITVIHKIMDLTNDKILHALVIIHVKL
jgi:hypothetical protein